MPLILRLFAAVALFVLPRSSAAQELQRPWTFERTEVHTLISASGDSYELAVALPRTYAAGGSRYPVLVVLDGDVLFPIAAQLAVTLAHENARELIVVGLGARPITTGIRVRDFTPTVAPEPRSMEHGPDDGLLTGGGAAAFLSFIRLQVIPFIEERYRTEPTERGVFGHSYGGLFALYALFHASDTFSRYIVSSPSLWWDETVILRFEERYARDHHDLTARVFLGNGEFEESPEDARQADFAQLTNAARLAKQLAAREYPSFRLESHVFDGEAHMTVIPFTLSRGIRALYPKSLAP